jgi:hypothetical protein
MIMPKPPLDRPVADQARTAGDLTDYDHEHLVTYLRLLDADAEGADWAEVARLCCILIHPMNPSGRDAPGRATLRAPNGLSSMDTGICFGAALRNDVTALAYRSIPTAHSCG